MIKWFYLYSLIVSIVTLVIYYEKTRKNCDKNYLILFISAFLCNYGYAEALFSETLGAFLPGFQIYYIASIYACIFLLICISDMCGYKLSKTFKCALLIVSIFLDIMIAFIAVIPLFYKDLTFFIQNGTAYMTKQYGPGHTIFVLFILTINLASFGFVIFSWIKHRNVSFKTLISLSILAFYSTTLFFLPKLFNLNIELIPFAYSTMTVQILILQKHTTIYDSASNLLNVYETKTEFGFITLDIKKRYIESNDFANRFFPELQTIRVDTHFPASDGLIYTKVIPWITLWEENDRNIDPLTLEIDDLSITCYVQYITAHNKNIGYYIELSDNTEANKYMDFLSIYNKQLEDNVEEKALKIVQIQDSIITGMASMVESRDNSTGGHINRTSHGVRIFLNQLKKHPEFSWVTEEFINNMIKAAPMHDLGKIAINDAILKKPGKFTEEDYEEMKKHSSEGAKIVLGVLKEVDDKDLKTIASNVAHYHHERWDGSGYPTGKKGKEIPIEARIMAFADVFDALVTKRCYKEPFTYDQAFEIIQQELGSHFDPILGKVFLECRPELEEMYNNSNNE